MSLANSSFLGKGGTSLEAAMFPLYLCTMRDTNPSPNGSICTSIMAAALHCLHLHLCTMSLTNSSLLNVGGTVIEAASFPFYLGAMCDTHSSFNNYVGTTVKGTSFPCCATCVTQTPPFWALFVHPS
jgi:hypothetical protein